MTSSVIPETGQATLNAIVAAAEDGIAVAQTPDLDPRIVVLDTSDPQKPALAGQLDGLPSSGAGIHLTNGRLALRYADYDHSPLSFELFDVVDAFGVILWIWIRRSEPSIRFIPILNALGALRSS